MYYKDAATGTLCFLFLLALCNVGKHDGKFKLPVDTAIPFVASVALIKHNGSKHIMF